MKELRLLSRLKFLEGGKTRNYNEDPEKKIKSIINYLTKLLNTRQGGSSIDYDLGMPDLNSMLNSLPDSIDTIKKAIIRNITLYEPRIKILNVEHIKNPNDYFRLHFQIEAELKQKTANISLIFESIIESDGNIHLES